MPLYQFRCPRCGAEAEHRLAIADLERSLIYCPDCAEAGADPQDVRLERVYTALFAIWGTKVRP